MTQLQENKADGSKKQESTGRYYNSNGSGTYRLLEQSFLCLQYGHTLVYPLQLRTGGSSAAWLSPAEKLQKVDFTVGAFSTI